MPNVFSIAAVIALALVASLLPAWRASLVSPLVAIRNERDSVWTSARRTLEQARQRISTEKAPQPVDATLLTEFIEASRRADSFSEVPGVYLRDLLAKLHAESALLLEKISPGKFHCLAAAPESHSLRWPFLRMAFS